VRGVRTGSTTLFLSPIRLSFVDWVTGGERQRGGNYLCLLGGCGSHKSSLSILILVTWDTWSLAGPAGVLEPSLEALRAAKTPGYVSRTGFLVLGFEILFEFGLVTRRLAGWWYVPYIAESMWASDGRGSGGLAPLYACVLLSV
jgi:hypothetical protein